MMIYPGSFNGPGPLWGIFQILGSLTVHTIHNSVPHLLDVRGWVDFEDSAVQVPSLNTIGRTMFSTGWVGSAPKLKSVNGREYWWAGKIEL